MRRDSLMATVTLSCLLVAGSFSLASAGPSVVKAVSGRVAGVQSVAPSPVPISTTYPVPGVTPVFYPGCSHSCQGTGGRFCDGGTPYRYVSIPTNRQFRWQEMSSVRFYHFDYEVFPDGGERVVSGEWLPSIVIPVSPQHPPSPDSSRFPNGYSTYYMYNPGGCPNAGSNLVEFVLYFDSTGKLREVRYHFQDLTGNHSEPVLYHMDITTSNIVPRRDSTDSVDTDGDGLADATENDVYGTDPQRADTDGDGHPDGLEVRYGYSPLGSGKLTAEATSAKSADLSIVRVAGDKNVYLRNGLTVSRIANPQTLNQLGTFVSSRQVVGQAQVNELQPAPVVDEGAVEELRPIVPPRLPVLDLTVSLSTSTPQSQTLADGTMLNYVFTVQASASIRPVVVTGLMVNLHTSSTMPTSTAVDGVSVWEGNARRGTATFGAGEPATLVTLATPIVVPARQTRFISVAADLPAQVQPGSAFYLSFDRATDIHVAANRRVRGTYPVAGNWMWVVDGSTTLGALGVSTLPVDGYATAPSSSTLPNVTVGSQPTVDFVRTRLAENSSHEDLGLRELRYTIEGTVNPATDLADFELLFGSMPVMTVPHVTGRTLTFSLNDWPIPAGSIRNFSVRAQVTSGAGRWFRFALQDYRDVATRGLTTGFTPRPNVSVPWEPLASQGGYWVIGEAQDNAPLQVMRSPIFGQSQTVAPGAQNAILGVYTLTNVAAEPVHLLSLHLDLSTSTPWVTNLVLYAAISTGTTSTLPFTNVIGYAGSPLNFDPNQAVWLAPGASLDVELRGNVSSSTPGGYLFTSYVPALGIGAVGPADQFGIGTIHDGPTQQVTGHNVTVVP